MAGYLHFRSSKPDRPGLMLLSAIFLGGTLALLQLGTVWMRRWRPEATRQARIFCYRDRVKELLGGEAA